MTEVQVLAQSQPSTCSTSTFTQSPISHRWPAPAANNSRASSAVSASTHHCSTRVTWTVAWKVLSSGFCFRATTAMGRLPDESLVGWILIRATGENKLATRPAMQGQRSSTLHSEQSSFHIGWSSVTHLYGVSRGPACILERLPETFACLVSGCIVSREQRARENHLQSDQ